MIRLKRVYKAVSKQDGFRVLVERLWPRGITKERAAIDLWLKDVAPSPRLRTWFGHEPSKWSQFRERYWTELKKEKGSLSQLRQHTKKHTVTFVYAARDEQHNSAVVLKEFIERSGR